VGSLRLRLGSPSSDLPARAGQRRSASRGLRRPLARRLALVLPLALSLTVASPAVGQGDARPLPLRAYFAGSETEDYLRLLQVTGRTPFYPWSLRAFSPHETVRVAPRDVAHPWGERLHRTTYVAGPVEYSYVDAGLRVLYNSGFPFGTNLGGVWAGRGLTGTLEAGVWARYGPLTLVVAPTLLWSQNAAFDLVPHVLSDSLPLADPRRPTQIDLPQRFGETSFARLDPGQTTLRADWAGLAAGVSTANQAWGPAVEYPILLGNHAPGFLHGFAGTSSPWNLGIGSLHGRLLWGRLEQSDYSPVPADSLYRFTSGAVAVFSPRWLPGVEVGAARFFHQPWPGRGLNRAHILKPFEALLKDRLYDGDLIEPEESVVANQLASVFARLVLPGSGFEIYGEYGSEDHRHNLRDLVLQPDHSTVFTLGMRRVWERDGTHFLVTRGELVNADRSHLHRNRRQEPFYVHAGTRQGHTQRGMVLGSPAVYGGGGATLAADLFHPGGRWTVTWERMVRRERGDFLQTGVPNHPDMLHALGAEGLLLRGSTEISAGLRGAYNFNRDFRGDAFNLSASLGLRAAF
jgi:hypothetical protein